MALITINSLKINTHIGCLAWERAVQQTVILDLAFVTDSTLIAASDDINQALDYSRVADRITDFVSNSQYQLIETLAERVADLLSNEFSMTNLRLCISKPGAIKNASSVNIVVTRGNIVDNN